jgi:hypothetical protein
LPSFDPQELACPSVCNVNIFKKLLQGKNKKEAASSEGRWLVGCNVV